MQGFVVGLVERHRRTRQERQATYFIEHGATHTAVGEVFKVHTFAGVKHAGGFQQTHHPDLNQFIEFHVGWDAGFQMQGDSLDQAEVGQHQLLTLGARLLVHLHG